MSEHGNELFVLDLAKFEQNIAAFRDAFRSRYERTEIAYSVKTNYIPELCQIVERRGLIGEVVSETEFDLFKSLASNSSRIICNGPAKSVGFLTKAMSAGALINVDNLEELTTLRALASKHRSSVRVGLRLNPLAERSRFGLAPVDAAEAFAMCRADDALLFEGVHCHICPNDRSAANYRRYTESVLQQLVELDLLDSLKSLNLGGGFMSPMSETMAREWNFEVPNFDHYAEAICEPVKQAFGTRTTTLILEPGIAVTADIMDYYCKVLSIKSVGVGQVATASGNIYAIKPSKSQRNLPLSVSRPDGVASQKSATPTHIVGATCMEDDFMHRGLEEHLRVGDVLCFGHVGAYTNVLQPNFIHPPAPVVCFRDNGDHYFVRHPVNSAKFFGDYNVSLANV